MAEQNWTGIYRAKVIDSHDPEKKGRVKIWCPVTMPNVQPDKTTQDIGLWAFMANNPLGGRNFIEDGEDQYNQGTCFLPQKGSWVYIFFEDADPSQPRVLAACDIGNTFVPPENQQGSEYEKKWTLLKSQKGRAAVISDDPHDERVELTGKKRMLNNSSSSSGDSNSVYAIEGNQNVILLDERDGKEKILIKDYKGNFINFDITKQQLHVSFYSDMHIKTYSNLYLQSMNDMHITARNFSLTALQNIDIRSGLNTRISQTNLDIQSEATSRIFSKSDLHIRTNTNLNMDGTMSYWQQNLSVPAVPAKIAIPPVPIGMRQDPSISPQLSDSEPSKSDIIPKLKKYKI